MPACLSANPEPGKRAERPRPSRPGEKVLVPQLDCGTGWSPRLHRFAAHGNGEDKGLAKGSFVIRESGWGRGKAGARRGGRVSQFCFRRAPDEKKDVHWFFIFTVFGNFLAIGISSSSVGNISWRLEFPGGRKSPLMVHWDFQATEKVR
jgi:hypothetical protein